MITYRTPYIIFLLGSLTPILLKKRLAELTIVSILLAMCFSIMIGGFMYQILKYGTSINPDYNHNNPENNDHDYFKPSFRFKMISTAAVMQYSVLL